MAEKMTRDECELAIAERFKEIVKIYRSYNPNGRYLTMVSLDDYISFNNEDWDADKENPISYREFIGEEEEIDG